MALVRIYADVTEISFSSKVCNSSGKGCRSICGLITYYTVCCWPLLVGWQWQIALSDRSSRLSESKSLGLQCWVSQAKCWVVMARLLSTIPVYIPIREETPRDTNWNASHSKYMKFPQLWRSLILHMMEHFEDTFCLLYNWWELWQELYSPCVYF